MTARVCLLRVGIDTGCGGMLGPLFRDGSFEFVPIPENDATRGRTYGEINGKKTGQPLSSFFPVQRQKRVAKIVAHYDPEFDTFTYGDPTRPKRSLNGLRGGDLLVFYAGLKPHDFEDNKKLGLYIIGYFEVEVVGLCADFSAGDLNALFSNNFHVKHGRDEKELILVKGGMGSRLLQRAQLISKAGLDRVGHGIYVLSDEAQKKLGSFTELNAIQRSMPRWVSPEETSEAARWIRELP